MSSLLERKHESETWAGAWRVGRGMLLSWRLGGREAVGGRKKNIVAPLILSSLWCVCVVCHALKSLCLSLYASSPLCLSLYGGGAAWRTGEHGVI